MISPNKDLEKILKQMAKAGYLVEKTSGHIKIVNPTTGGLVFIASTPRGGSRTLLNIRRDLKRIGWPDQLPETA